MNSLFGGLLTLLLTLSCSLSPPPASVVVKLKSEDLAAPRVGPALSGFQKYLLVVRSQGTSSTYSSAQLQNRDVGCLLLDGQVIDGGDYSTLTTQGLRLVLPLGTVELLFLGVQNVAVSGTSNLLDYFRVSTRPEVYLLARKTTEIRAGANVTLKADYDPSRNLISQCPIAPVTEGLVLNLDAADAKGVSAGPHAAGCPSTALTWVDLTVPNLSTLNGFGSCSSTRGWNGDGSTAMGALGPYRLSFDGTPNSLLRVEIPHSIALSVSGDLTTCSWVFPTQNGTDNVWHVILSKRNGYDVPEVAEYEMFLQRGGHAYNNGTNPLLPGALGFYVRNSGTYSEVNSTSVVSTNAWHYLCVTLSGSTVRFYDNANPIGLDFLLPGSRPGLTNNPVILGQVGPGAGNGA